ncbi:2373_t:CDS:2 [Diversispora eburnea]|uniref:2373_t:CDS:1 n=1 Tax=Diversispora eburnea TaxID=1213867 RepID=A0A9N9FB77_9GLOM|nr:2373_t:CDS:2 [Diversispora eburnea]
MGCLNTSVFILSTIIVALITNSSQARNTLLNGSDSSSTGTLRAEKNETGADTTIRSTYYSGNFIVVASSSSDSETPTASEIPTTVRSNISTSKASSTNGSGSGKAPSPTTAKTTTSSKTTSSKKVVQHDELPPVKNELSVTLRLNLQSHNPNWISIFHKGIKDTSRTPGLWLTPENSRPYARFSTNDNTDYGLDAIGTGLVLNKWYHMGYTLSEPHKRLDFYLNGKWVGFKSIDNVQTQHTVFNEDPLSIGNSPTHPAHVDFKGQMSNFRYYNWRLSADEIAKDFSLRKEMFGEWGDILYNIKKEDGIAGGTSKTLLVSLWGALCEQRNGSTSTNKTFLLASLCKIISEIVKPLKDQVTGQLNLKTGIEMEELKLEKRGICMIKNCTTVTWKPPYP